jgi:hypothetical protein
MKKGRLEKGSSEERGLQIVLRVTESWVKERWVGGKLEKAVSKPD